MASQPESNTAEKAKVPKDACLDKRGEKSEDLCCDPKDETRFVGIGPLSQEEDVCWHGSAGEARAVPKETGGPENILEESKLCTTRFI